MAQHELGIEPIFWNDEQAKEVRAVAPVAVRVAKPVGSLSVDDGWRFSD
jgi:hypothetical protein